MDRYTYTLNREAVKKKKLHYYSEDELLRMTIYQLRDICWREQIINGIQAPMDKDELIRQILRFRGRKKHLYISTENEEGKNRIEYLLQHATIHCLPQEVKGCAKIVAYESLAITYLDGFTIGYIPQIANTNALLMSGNKLCAIFQIQQKNDETDCLYLTKYAELDCEESMIKNYKLYCMDQSQSEWIYRIYETEPDTIPEHLNFYVAPVMDFQVRELQEINMPLAIDFGTTNTTAGTYLDSGYFEKLQGDPVRNTLIENQVNYVKYIKKCGDGREETIPILPSVVGVSGIDGDQVQYVFGYQANEMLRASYIDEEFCVFYDIKRWISDPSKEEELVDHNGHRCFVQRKDIIKAFLEYVISCATQQFKCRFVELHISAPVKQKKLFIRLYKKILPEYIIEEEEMLDEGVAVLYNSISNLITRKQFTNGKELKALIVDCGGGTTDLSSCRFTITNQRVSYKIDIATSYENGDTDFGGNNLTYRIMELLKIAIVEQLNDSPKFDSKKIMEGFDEDIYRVVDQNGCAGVYKQLDEMYNEAEQVIPTRFQDYEHRSNREYYAVKNNFYYLFDLAEQIKKAFYGEKDILRMVVSGIMINENATFCILADKFKLSVREDEKFRIIKDIPTVYFSINTINNLLRADIYGIVKRFIENSYETGELQEYSIMRLTGQSCRVGLFREALKEFIPGKIIESSRSFSEQKQEYELKLMCLDGAIKYIKDKRFGYADIQIKNDLAAFPYLITAVTHTNEEKILISGLNRKKTQGYISRNIAELTLQLYLKDITGVMRYKYNCTVSPEDFEMVEAETIIRKYDQRIIQDDIDSIVNKELRFFVITDESRWGFIVIPIMRKNERLMIAENQFFMFETENWLTNFFDGTK